MWYVVIISSRLLRQVEEEEHQVSGNDVSYSARWRGTFIEPFELQDFPFDLQDFHIKLMACTKGLERTDGTLDPCRTRLVHLGRHDCSEESASVFSYLFCENIAGPRILTRLRLPKVLGCR